MKVKNERELLDLALNAAWEKDDPRLAWMLSNLAGVSSVSFSENIDTACIKKSGNKYMIRFSRNFVQKYLKTPDDVLFVLLHEIMHKVQGDLVRGRRLKNRADAFVMNMVEDMLINAWLCENFFPNSTPLFSELYDRDAFPDALLVPPADFAAYLQDKETWEGQSEKAGLPPARRRPANRWSRLSTMPRLPGLDWPGALCLRHIPAYDALQEFLPKHFDGLKNSPDRSCPEDKDNFGRESIGMELFDIYSWPWFMHDVTAADQVYEMLRPLFPSVPELILLGDHEDSSGGMDGWGDIFGDHGAGYSEEEKEDEIDVEVPRQHVNKMIRMIRQAVEPDPMNPLEAFTIQPERSVLPWPGRRENLWLAHGLWPVFFKPSVYTRDLEYLRPHVYIDVSASTSEHQPMIYGLVSHLADLIGELIYLFSNTVAEASIEHIRTGKVRTTGGTDFDCVIEHALKNHFRKIILITDGCADMKDQNKMKAKAEEPEIYLVLTERNYHYDDDIHSLAKNVFYLSSG